MKKTILSFGLISSIILIAFIVGFSIFKWGSAVIGYSAMIIAFSFIFVGVRSFRDKHNGGTIGFGKAFRLGLGIAFIGSTAYVIAWMIDYTWFMPDFMDRYSALMIKQAQESGITGSALEQKIAGINRMKELYKNPIIVVLYTYLEVLPVGIVISLLVALILKRKNRKPAVQPRVAAS